MAIFDRARENAEAIREIGERAREEARWTNTSICYWDKSTGAIIREYPDGRRERVANEAEARRQCLAVNEADRRDGTMEFLESIDGDVFGEDE